jgi:hypothetical protein
MAGYKEPAFQDRVAAAAKAREAALARLKAKPPIDPAVVAERIEKERAREVAAAERAAQRAAELEAARLESSEKYFDVRLRHSQEDMYGQFQQNSIQQSDTLDKLEFRQMCADSPALKAIQNDVEKELANLRRMGGNAARAYVAKYILGDRAMANATKSKNKNDKQAENVRRRESVRKGSPARSDVVRENRRGGDEHQQRYDRIKDIPI